MKWIVLNYNLPTNPSKNRVAVWRQLKKAGSIIFGQSMWILPLSDSNKEIFHNLSLIIEEEKGSSFISISEFRDTDEAKLVKAFNEARDEEYTEFLGHCNDFLDEIKKETKKEHFSYAEIEENEYEINKLKSWIAQIQEKDFFSSKLSAESKDALNGCITAFDIFCKEIYRSNLDLTNEDIYDGGN